MFWALLTLVGSAFFNGLASIGAGWFAATFANNNQDPWTWHHVAYVSIGTIFGSVIWIVAVSLYAAAALAAISVQLKDFFNWTPSWLNLSSLSDSGNLLAAAICIPLFSIVAGFAFTMIELGLHYTTDGHVARYPLTEAGAPD